MVVKGETEAAPATRSEDELRDLNEGDAQELRNFLEKRRWFESKLKVLEDIPPIYPFVHPRLEYNNRGTSRLDGSPSQWRLPSIEQVKQWQRERDQIEEEVLEFDDGDLDRIKKKTRVETERIRQEVDSVVRDKGRWTPAGERLQTPQTPKVEEANTVAPQTPPRPSVPTVSSIASSLNSVHLSPDLRSNSPGRSPSRLHATPKRSLHVPLLHSQLINIQIRHQSLATTKLSRSGVILDRMIDVAGPLKGLGDVNGPTEAKDGAVPDELLDVQDELEAEVRQVGGKVLWCKELEDHWKSERYRQLAEILETAQNRIPPPLDISSPNPTHPDYPENDNHNAEVVTELRGVREEAAQAIQKCRTALDWYRDLVNAREEMVTKQRNVSEISEAVVQALALVDNGTVEIKRPDLCNEEEVKGSVGWTESVSIWVDDAKGHADAARLVSQQAALACQKYRNALRVPLALRDEFQVYQDKSIRIVDDEAENLLRLAQKITLEVKTASQDKVLVDIGRPMVVAASSILVEQGALLVNLDKAVRQLPWPDAERGLREDYSDALRRLEERIDAEVNAPYNALRSQENAFGRARTLSLSFDTIDRVKTFRQDLKRLCDLMERLMDQASVVRVITQEAEKFLHDINHLQESNEGESALALDALNGEVAAWRATLADRVPFLSGDSSPSANGHPVPDSLVSSRQTNWHGELDLTEINQRARDSVNEQALQVAAAIADHQSREADLRWADWSQRCHRAAEQVDRVLSEWQEYHMNLETQIGRSARLIDEERIEDLTSAIYQHVTRLDNCAAVMEEVVGQVSEIRQDREKEASMWQSAAITARGVVSEAIEEAKKAEKMVSQQRKPSHSLDVFDSTAPGVEVLQELSKPSPVSAHFMNGSSNESLENPNGIYHASRPSSVMSTSRLPRLSGSLPRVTNRSASNPKTIFNSPTLARSLSRNRAVSDTPSRTRLHSLGSSGIPRPSKVLIPEVKATPKPIKGYVADPQNRLDVAVGKIVNKLEGLQEANGRMSLGSIGLVPRVVRDCAFVVSSNLVLSWSGLVVDGWSCPGPIPGHETLPPSQSNSSLASILSDVPSTPPRLVKSISSQSLDGSPLAAFQFMKKASESPSIREKEKELFHGRRSILGRE
ncbi:hypothetical protein IAT40_006124 [Kwoniella sp. CBS 6097]